MFPRTLSFALYESPRYLGFSHRLSVISSLVLTRATCS